LPTRPRAEGYDHPQWALANTHLAAQSPHLRHRHAAAQLRRLRFEVSGAIPRIDFFKMKNKTSENVIFNCIRTQMPFARFFC
jgi:hypothetical protein